KLRLKPFSSCQRLVKYAHHNVKRELRYASGPAVAPGVPPPFSTQSQGSPGTSGPETAPTPSAGTGDSSQTNVQEQGVDEPDFVKFDGTHLFALVGNRLNAVDARAATPKLAGSLELDPAAYGGEMLLYGKRVLVFSYGPGPVEPLPSPAVDNGSGQATAAPAYFYRPSTLITEVDVSDPAAMRVVRTETIDGTYVSARLNGSTARIVLTTPPAVIDYGQPETLNAKARGWLPRARIENKLTGTKRTRQVAGCRQVRRPERFAGLDVLTVLTVDMKKGLPEVDSDELMTDGQTVYASNDALYVATQRFVVPAANPDQPPPPIVTAIHRFDISQPGRTAYSSTGEAPGYVIGQFALSEFQGVLRVASTDSPVWWEGAARPQPKSYVTTLKESGGVMLPLGRVGGIGEGEQIRAVRFLGDAGYVVTFRQVDPLFTIDLSQPDAPRVAGELKLLGYSAYLHPVGDGLLLGVGQDATDQGAQLGTQLSLFDVSDLAHPARLAQRRVGPSSSSEAEYDHHAFLYWPPTKLAVLPVNIFDGSGDPFNGAIGFRVGRTKIDEAGRIEHKGDTYTPGIRRALVVGSRLFTISDLGAKASSLSTLADEAFVPFPQPPQQQPDPGGPPQPGPPQPAR
ncbi:MAG: hypothetical protein QOC77_757, partial [Thermoleophilaceae bacterium]|nr:hypothetical protein [Thermoleophilaceae bacterium]